MSRSQNVASRRMMGEKTVPVVAQTWVRDECKHGLNEGTEEATFVGACALGARRHLSPPQKLVGLLYKTRRPEDSRGRNYGTISGDVDVCPLVIRAC